MRFGRSGGRLRSSARPRECGGRLGGSHGSLRRRRAVTPVSSPVGRGPSGASLTHVTRGRGRSLGVGEVSRRPQGPAGLVGGRPWLRRATSRLHLHRRSTARGRSRRPVSCRTSPRSRCRTHVTHPGGRDVRYGWGHRSGGNVLFGVAARRRGAVRRRYRLSNRRCRRPRSPRVSVRSGPLCRRSGCRRRWRLRCRDRWARRRCSLKAPEWCARAHGVRERLRVGLSGVVGSPFGSLPLLTALLPTEHVHLFLGSLTRPGWARPR